MRDPSVSPEWRFKAAHVAAPYVHPKAERAQAVDPAATAKQIEDPSEDPRKDPLYEALQAWGRAATEEREVESSRAQKAKMLSDRQERVTQEHSEITS
jgi:hypothetical protein